MSVQEHVMLDLETMSSENNGAIVSIGAFKWQEGEVQEPADVRPAQKFSAAIDLRSSVSAGLHMSPDTVLWWMEQSEAVRAAIRVGQPLSAVLSEFSAWLPADARVWGYGSMFDNVLLKSAYRSLGMKCPISYRNDMCFRTAKALFPDVAFVEYGERHIAVNDAVRQGLHMQRILALIKTVWPQRNWSEFRKAGIPI